jgi:hypothetical protein
MGIEQELIADRGYPPPVFSCNRTTGFFDVRNKLWFFTYHGFITITSSSRIISRDHGKAMFFPPSHRDSWVMWLIFGLRTFGRRAAVHVRFLELSWCDAIYNWASSKPSIFYAEGKSVIERHVRYERSLSRRSSQIRTSNKIPVKSNVNGDQRNMYLTNLNLFALTWNLVDRWHDISSAPSVPIYRVY